MLSHKAIMQRTCNAAINEDAQYGDFFVGFVGIIAVKAVLLCDGLMPWAATISKLQLRLIET